MTKKKKVTAATTAIVAAALLFAGSFAWVSTLQTATNKFRRSDYNVQLHDVFEGKEVVTDIDGENISETMEWTDDKDTLDKDIWVTNNGSGDILVQVKFLETLNINNQGEVINKTATTVLEGADAGKAYTGEVKTIRNNIEWYIGADEWSQSPTIMTYAEWCGITDPAKKVGKFWVADTGGNVIWMEPLKASDPDAETEPSAVGNTALLLDAVKLKDTVKGHVDYSIKVEMSAIDVDLVGLTQEGTTWTGGNVSAVAKAAASADKVKELTTKRDAITNDSVKMLYNEAINAALEGKSDEEISVLETKAQELQTKIESNVSYTQPAITFDETTSKYKLTDTAETEIDPVIAQWIADKYGRSAITDLTKADLAGIGSINTTNKGVESFSGLTAEYFPNLTSINLTSESGIVVDTSEGVNMDELNAMDDGLKKQLTSLTLYKCNGLKGNIDVSGFENLDKLWLRTCSNITGITGLSPKLKDINAEVSKIKAIDVSQCTELVYLNLWNCSSLGSKLSSNSEECGEIIGLNNLEKLESLTLTYSKIKKLDLSKANNLVYLAANNCTELEEIVFADKAYTNTKSNYLIYLKVVNDPKLKAIDISKMSLITSLDVTDCSIIQVTKRSDQTLIPDDFPADRITNVN